MQATVEEEHGIDPATYARRWTILGVLCLCLLVVMIANTSMNVALPILSRSHSTPWMT